MPKGMSKALIQKHAEMRNLKHEESAIIDLLAKVNDQINRLSIEDLKLNEVIMTKNVQKTVHHKQSQLPDPLSCVSNSSSSIVSSFQNSFKQHVSYPIKPNELPGFQNELPMDNLADLDLDVPATALEVEQRAYAEEDNYSEDDEEDECLLAL